VVTREELRQMLWPAGTFVDFEHGLNSSVKELRRALRDSANEPHYIETLHRRGYRFIAETSPSTEDHPRLVASHAQIVGRHHIISNLLDVWSGGERGTRQVLFLSGEAGIGKTTIVQQVLARATAAGTAKATWGQCIQHYGIGEPYQPLLEAIMRLCSQPDGARLVPVLERYAPTWLAQLPALLPPERHATLRHTVAGATRQRMLRELTDALEAATTQIPLVLCLEDLHWSDASTLDHEFYAKVKIGKQRHLFRTSAPSIRSRSRVTSRNTAMCSKPHACAGERDGRTWMTECYLKYFATRTVACGSFFGSPRELVKHPKSIDVWHLGISPAMIALWERG
jgi:hypothetical protein